tara:strand:+ start:717 stop:1055 length:339 start_codon:yes stop_codon:yes gene_type:complete
MPRSKKASKAKSPPPQPHTDAPPKLVRPQKLSDLKDLDDHLKTLHNEHNGSFSAFKKDIRTKGICLKNMFSYGSLSRLRSALRKDDSLVVNKEEAKQYKYVKLCLVNISGRN